MQVDITTLGDLSIFNRDEEQSVFKHLDFTKTYGGRECLRSFLNKPMKDLKSIEATQQVLKRLVKLHGQWPERITNGTVMVIDKFYETALEQIPRRPNKMNTFFYKLANGPDFALTRYSITHFVDFIQGMKEMADLLQPNDMPPMLMTVVERISMLLRKPMVERILKINKKEKLSNGKILAFGFFMRYHFKHEALELIDIYSHLDAYHSMATACIKYNFQFPEFAESEAPYIETEGLYHILLPTPVAYDMALTPERNFLFLTGANMAGKSTFIKALGVAVYLAHIGMAVPATSMRLCLFDGLLSNIQVVDNIVKGESYFFNEVQRIRKTIEKISDGRKWLILIDELFKGTNVQDAMKCSTAVIEGLRKMKNALFVLSTHLYEIADSLKQYSNIQFRYFETSIDEDQLVFSYQLKEGISNDRLGYLILKREGVVKLLEKI